jgi:hypothetical protein
LPWWFLGICKQIVEEIEMKNLDKNKLYAFMVAGAVLMCASPVSAVVYPGSKCIEDSTSGDLDYWPSGTVENDSSTSSAFAMCGLPTVAEASVVGTGSPYITYYVSPHTSIKVRVFDGSTTEQLQCTAYQRRMNSPSGSTYFVSSSTDSVGASASTTGSATLDLTFAATPSAYIYQNYFTVSCELPARGSTTSKIFALDAVWDTVVGN